MARFGVPPVGLERFDTPRPCEVPEDLPPPAGGFTGETFGMLGMPGRLFLGDLAATFFVAPPLPPRAIFLDAPRPR